MPGGMVTTYRLMDGVSGRPGVGSSGTQPPASPSAFTGNYLAGTAFGLTTNYLWLQGYEWWCPPGGDTGTQTFALWQFTETGHGVTSALVPATSVTSGTLTAGQFNFVPLATPVPLGANLTYVAATGYVAVNGFPLSVNQFGATQPYAGGIVNGPLFAYSDLNGSNPVPNPANTHQGLFDTTTANASAAPPLQGFQSGNFWIDVLVSDQPPVGVSYRLWPSQPYAMFWVNDTADNFTLGCEFTLSQPCVLTKIWYYSPAGVTQLPTECGIWNVNTQALVAGTDNAAPSWSGAAGSGWVSVSYGSITLPAGDYKVAVFNGAGSPAIWNGTSNTYWSTSGLGLGGVTSGPLSAPDTSHATSPGQDTYNLGTPFTYPLTYAAGAAGANYWVDVEVTPAQATPAPAPVLYSMRMMP